MNDTIVHYETKHFKNILNVNLMDSFSNLKNLGYFNRSEVLELIRNIIYS